VSTRATEAAAPNAGGLQITPRAAILVIVVVALLFYLVVPLRTYMAQRDRLRILEHQEQVLQQENAKLQRQVQHLNDPAYLERIARECLGMVRQGEIGFIVVPERGGKATPADC
jgi:cell division protein FtsB